MWQNWRWSGSNGSIAWGWWWWWRCCCGDIVHVHLAVAKWGQGCGWWRERERDTEPSCGPECLTISRARSFVSWIAGNVLFIISLSGKPESSGWWQAVMNANKGNTKDKLSSVCCTRSLCNQPQQQPSFWHSHLLPLWLISHFISKQRQPATTANCY